MSVHDACTLYAGMDCLKYAHENGCESCNIWTIDYAAAKGHLDCLKYAHENGCQWDAGTCSRAAEWGHLDCLQYAHENGCEWDFSTAYMRHAKYPPLAASSVVSESHGIPSSCSIFEVSQKPRCAAAAHAFSSPGHPALNSRSRIDPRPFIAARRR